MSKSHMAPSPSPAPPAEASAPSPSASWLGSGAFADFEAESAAKAGNSALVGVLQPWLTGAEAADPMSPHLDALSQWWSGDEEAEVPARADEGSAMFLGAAAESEVAYDRKFTPKLTDELEKAPEASLDEVLRRMDTVQLEAGQPGVRQPVHHPALAEYGTADAGRGEGSKKVGVYVANGRYTYPGMDLPGPQRDAAELAGAMTGRGYESRVLEDQTRDGMGAAYSEAVETAAAGDDVLLYYSGHGAPAGVVGRDFDPAIPDGEILTYSYMTTLLKDGAAKGVHVRSIVDACHSGAGARSVREERENDVKDAKTGVVGAVHLEALDALTGYRAQLLEHVSGRGAVMEEAAARIAELKNLLSPEATDEEKQAFRDQRKRIWDQRDALLMAYDRNVDAMWASMLTTLRGIAVLVWIDWPPESVEDYATLGAQIDWLDLASTHALDPVDDLARDG